LAFKSGSKLDKDDKSVMEELSTTNAEFKKVNEYLINEIEHLKRENDYLKVELLKMHMNESLSESSLCGSQQEVNTLHVGGGGGGSISNSSSSIITNSTSSSSNTTNSSSTNDLSSSSSNLNKSHDLLLATSPTGHAKSSSQNLIHAGMELSTVRAASTAIGAATAPTNTAGRGRCHTTSVGCTSGGGNNGTVPDMSQQNTRNSLCNRIDLSRYINDDDDDDNDDQDSGGGVDQVDDDDDQVYPQQNIHLTQDDYENSNNSDCGIVDRRGRHRHRPAKNVNADQNFFTSNLSINEFTID
jgi:hypothetical protein